jgi:hypothetical protein
MYVLACFQGTRFIIIDHSKSIQQLLKNESKPVSITQGIQSLSKLLLFILQEFLCFLLSLLLIAAHALRTPLQDWP